MNGKTVIWELYKYGHRTGTERLVHTVNTDIFGQYENKYTSHQYKADKKRTDDAFIKEIPHHTAPSVMPVTFLPSPSNSNCWCRVAVNGRGETAALRCNLHVYITDMRLKSKHENHLVSRCV